MQGAREYAKYFNAGEQVGRLYIVASHHARGRTLHVWVLPEGSAQKEGTYPSSDAVEVYGILGGQPGWTEHYGWLKRGPWEKDFINIVTERQQEAVRRKAEWDAQEAVKAAERSEKESALLATYSSR